MSTKSAGLHCGIMKMASAATMMGKEKEGLQLFRILLPVFHLFSRNGQVGNALFLQPAG